MPWVRARRELGVGGGLSRTRAVAVQCAGCGEQRGGVGDIALELRNVEAGVGLMSAWRRPVQHALRRVQHCNLLGVGGKDRAECGLEVHNEAVTSTFHIDVGDAAEVAVEIGVVFCLGENTVCNDVGDSLWAEIIYH